jgi:hypothetical protein
MRQVTLYDQLQEKRQEIAHLRAAMAAALDALPNSFAQKAQEILERGLAGPPTDSRPPRSHRPDRPPGSG